MYIYLPWINLTIPVIITIPRAMSLAKDNAVRLLADHFTLYAFSTATVTSNKEEFMKKTMQYVDTKFVFYVICLTDAGCNIQL